MSRIKTFTSTRDIPGLILSHDPHTRSVVVQVGIHIGSKNERPGNWGLAHLLEHLMFRGTFTHPSLVKMATLFTQFGTSANGTTAYDYTTFYAKVLPYAALDVLKLLIQMVKQPLLDNQFLSLEKKAVMNELQTQLSEPGASLVGFTLIPHLFSQNPALLPYAHPAVGSKHDVPKLCLDQVIEFYQSGYLDPARIVLCLHGDLSNLKDLKDLKDLIEKIWMSVPYRRIVCETSGFEDVKPQNCLRDFTSFLNNHHLIQTSSSISINYLAMGWLSYPFGSFESQVLEWICAYLTGTYISKLFLELRVKRGIVYSIHCEQVSHEKAGAFVISWQQKNQTDICLSRDVILQNVNALKTFNDEKALMYWKRWLLQRQFLRQDDTMFVSSFYLKQMLFQQEVLPVRHMLEMIASITLEDVRKVAQEIFSPSPLSCSLSPNSPFQ